jgi:hypothetical protein
VHFTEAKHVDKGNADIDTAKKLGGFRSHHRLEGIRRYGAIDNIECLNPIQLITELRYGTLALSDLDIRTLQ